MAEIRTAIPEEVDAYLDALVQKGVFSNKAELVRAALVSYVNATGTFFQGFDAENVFAPRWSTVSGRVRTRIRRAGRHGGGHRLRGRSSARGRNPRKVEALARRKENPVAWRAFGSRVRRSCRRRGARRG